MYILTRHGDPQGDSTPPRAGEHRSETLRFRRSYARRGIPTSPADVAKKKPLLKGWQKRATTSLQQITAEANAFPDAGILTPTGREYGPHGRWVLDVDDFEDLARLEELLGIKLRGTSTEVRTQSGRLHIHFLWTGSTDIRNSVGGKVNDGFDYLDVRGGGGLAILPPSSGYAFANNLKMVKAPPELVAWAAGRSRRRDAGGADRTRVELEEGESVGEGARNNALFDGCYERRQQGRSPEEVEAWALSFNAERCSPPLPEGEVLTTARSACGYPVRGQKKDPEAERIGRNAWRSWWNELVPRGGRSKLRDSARVLLENALEHPNVVEAITEDGEVRKAMVSSISCRQGGPRAGTSHMSFARAMKKLEESGRILKGNDDRREDHSQTWLILDPATNCYTSGQAPPQGGDDWGVTPGRGPELTPCFRWRHPVGNARGGTLAAAEVYGPKTSEELAEIMGYSRVRDFERIHLRPLVERGDLVERDGLYGRPDDYRERMEDELQTTYPAWKRRRISVDPSGMETRWVEYGPERSDVERDERDQKKYEEHRRKFREYLEKKRRAFQDPANSADELLEIPRNLYEADGRISELEPVEEPEPMPDEAKVFELARGASVFGGGRDHALADALADYLSKNPHRRRETPSWLAVALWAEGSYPTKPAAENVGDAMALLEMPA